MVLMSLFSFLNIGFLFSFQIFGGTLASTNLANFVPAGLQKLCLCEGVFLMSSEIFHGRNPGKTLSDPVILAGGSWTLGRFDRLFSSGEDSMEEGENLVFRSLEFHSMCHNTTPFQNTIGPIKVLVCKQYIWECSTVKDVNCVAQGG